MKRFIIATLLCVISFGCQSQNNKDIVASVLSKNIAGRKFYYNLSDNKKYLNKAIITYLGSVQTNTEKYHILIGTRIWGSNKHTTGVIFLYDNKKKFFGKYILGGMDDLPIKLDYNDLIFNNANKDECDHHLITRIDFSTIPKNIFIKCKGDLGDIYELTMEK